jgi:hypothetical protein
MKFPNLNEKIGECKWFQWSEALWLPKWHIYGFPRDEVTIKNIEKTAMAMDKIRVMFGKPIFVTSWYRPEQYNKLVGGAKRSAHVLGMACDFLVQDHESNAIREMLRRYLKDINIRMEKLDTVHVHIDIRCDETMSNDARYFKP